MRSSFILFCALFLACVSAQNTTVNFGSFTLGAGASVNFTIDTTNTLLYPYLTVTNLGAVQSVITVRSNDNSVILPAGVTELGALWGSTNPSAGSKLAFALTAVPEVPIRVTLVTPVSFALTKFNLFSNAIVKTDATLLDSSFVGVVQSQSANSFLLPTTQVSRAYSFGIISPTTTTINVLPQVVYSPVVAGNTYRFSAQTSGFVVKVLNVTGSNVSIQQNNTFYDTNRPLKGTSKVIAYVFSLAVSGNVDGQVALTSTLPGFSSNSNNTALAVFSSWFTSANGNTDVNAWTALPSTFSNPDGNGVYTITGNFSLSSSAQYTVASNPPASSAISVVVSTCALFFALFVTLF